MVQLYKAELGTESVPELDSAIASTTSTVLNESHHVYICVCDRSGTSKAIDRKAIRFRDCGSMDLKDMLGNGSIWIELKNGEEWQYSQVVAIACRWRPATCGQWSLNAVCTR